MAKVEPTIVIREVRGKKRVGFRGIKHIEMPEEEMRELIEKYGDTLISLQEIDEEFDGLDWRWHVGRVVDEMDDRAQFAKLNRYSPIDFGDDYTLKRYHNFYRMFPDADYDPTIKKSIYMELCVGERLDESRVAYDRMIEADIHPPVYAIRAWSKLEDVDTKSVVEALLKEGKHQTSNLGPDKLYRVARDVFVLGGRNPEGVDREVVESTYKALTQTDAS